MKNVKEVLHNLINQKITIDEAEGQIDFIIMSWDCVKERGVDSGLFRKVRQKDKSRS